MKCKAFLFMVLMANALLVKAQAETKFEQPKYFVLGINFAPLLASQFQMDAEFGKEGTYISLMVSAFYGKNGAYENYKGEVFSNSQNYGLGVGLRIYETAFGDTRFFFQPSMYYKQLAVTYSVMRFIPYTYDGLPAMRWGEANQTDEYRGFVGEAIAGAQSTLGPFIMEGGFGFVYRNLNPMQADSKSMTPGAAMVLGLSEFSPVVQLKVGYKF